ncbi:hypothetical protein JXB28_05100 [Candidatus Woesearchaeota archaeon]|nr:hypothetical protein [Candidatus Woesearchaeota archaeon]
MDAKKGLAGLVLGAFLSLGAIAGPQVVSQQPRQQQKQEHKHQQLRLQLHKDHRVYLPEQFSLAQKYLQSTGKDYAIVRAPGDNMPIIVPNLSKWPMPTYKPAPGWPGDPGFEKQPGLEWQLPKGWLKNELYKNDKGKRVPGALLYQHCWKRM